MRFTVHAKHNREPIERRAARVSGEKAAAMQAVTDQVKNQAQATGGGIPTEPRLHVRRPSNRRREHAGQLFGQECQPQWGAAPVWRWQFLRPDTVRHAERHVLAEWVLVT
jgi:hypothetical protein